MVLDSNGDSLGPAYITDSVGTSGMSVINYELTWNNDRFGYWLLCNGAEAQKYELYWWDLVTNQQVDYLQCSEVQLILETA